MNAERFQALAEAYGADIRRWPAKARADAAAFAVTAGGRGALARAAALDEVLDGHAAPSPSAEMRARLLEAAPLARPRWAGFPRWAWAPGAGLAAAGLAGVVFGAALSGSWTPGAAESLLAEAPGFDETLLLADAGGGLP